MINEDIIEFDDVTDFHNIPMYRSLLFWSLPLLTRTMVLNESASLNNKSASLNDANNTKIRNLRSITK